MKDHKHTLIQLQNLALNLIQITQLERAGVRDGALLPARWTEDGHYIFWGSDPLTTIADEIAQAVRELGGEAGGNPMEDNGTECLIMAGGYEFGVESYAGKVKFHRDPEDAVQVAIPNAMKWDDAVTNIRKVLDDLEYWIRLRTNTTIGKLDMITEREADKADEGGEA